MASGARLREKDNGAAALLKRMAAAAQRQGVSLGVFEGEAPRKDDEVTNLDVAAFAEFGTATSEPRPWLSGWYDEEEARNRAALRKIGEAVIKGVIPSVNVGLDRFGLLGRGDIQQRIRAGIPPPNADVTVALKGSSTPLIDSGQFWSSVTHKLER